MEALARDAAKTAATMLRAEQCPAGVMPVVIGSGFGGVIFHEACGHSLEATQVAFGNSEFAGKLGQQIASPLVTAIDDGTIPNEWGSINIDDEGTPTNRLVLIENGILKNYMIDRLNGRRMGMPVNRQRAQAGLHLRAHVADAQHLHRARLGRRGRDHTHRRRRAVRQANGRRLGQSGDGRIQLRGGRGVPDPRRQDRSPGARRHADRQGRYGADRASTASPRICAWARACAGRLSGSVPVNVGQPMIRVTSMTVGGR